MPKKISKKLKKGTAFSSDQLDLIGNGIYYLLEFMKEEKMIKKLTEENEQKLVSALVKTLSETAVEESARKIARKRL